MGFLPGGVHETAKFRGRPPSTGGVASEYGGRTAALGAVGWCSRPTRCPHRRPLRSGPDLDREHATAPEDARAMPRVTAPLGGVTNEIAIATRTTPRMEPRTTATGIAIALESPRRSNEIKSQTATATGSASAIVGKRSRESASESASVIRLESASERENESDSANESENESASESVSGSGSVSESESANGSTNEIASEIGIESAIQSDPGSTPLSVHREAAASFRRRALVPAARAGAWRRGRVGGLAMSRKMWTATPSPGRPLASKMATARGLSRDLHVSIEEPLLREVDPEARSGLAKIFDKAALASSHMLLLLRTPVQK